MKIQLSEHFTLKKLLKFVFPSIVMMIFTSVYGVVDGIFVSNFVGKIPFAAVNLIMPFLMILGTLGFMIGTGGSAIISKTLGEGDKEKANQYFSMLIYVIIVLGAVLTALGLIFMRPISILLGANGEMLENCVLYGNLIITALIPYMLLNSFQSFFVAAGKPQLGLGATVAAGVTNMVLDFVFIVLFQWGIAGAAIATAISQLVGGVIPLFYFSSKNSSSLHLGKTKMYWKILLKTCANGSSELMTNLSMSIVNMLYNYKLMEYIGEDGVAAYGVIMYVNFIFVSIFLGYSIGSAPIVSYHYGAKNNSELKNLFHKSLGFVSVVGVVLTVLSISLSGVLSSIFVGYDAKLFEITQHGLIIFSISYLICGFNIYGSAFFTALNNGAISAAISFLRTLLFQIASVMILPLILGLDGIWLSITCAELCALVVTVIFLITNRKKYNY